MTLEFQVFSDIHLELLTPTALPRIPPRAKYLFLAGDIGGIKNENYTKFLDYCSANWEKVFYVFGNHEFYNRHSIETVIEKTQEIINTYPNIHLLNNSHVELDGYIIYGFIGWTKSIFPTTRQAKEYLNDYKYISTREGPLTIARQDELANTGTQLFKEFITNQTENKPIIVLTHFPPIQYSKYIGRRNSSDSLLQDYYGWPNLLEKKQINSENIICWISGHTHEAYDIIQSGIRYINNPIRYLGEHTGFTSDPYSITLA